MINYIIPMAGLGTRFIEAGYKIPKWLITAKNKTLLEWSVSSLPLMIGKKLIFIANRTEAEKYNLKELVDKLYSSFIDIELILLDQPTRGQAETALHAMQYIQPSESIGIFNIDTKFSSNTLESVLQDFKYNGVIGSFKSNSSKFSYAKLNSKNFVEKTAEKIVISEWALSGFYSFKEADDFSFTAKERIRDTRLEKGEFYIAPIYNDLIKMGKKYVLDETADIDILGTPEDLKRFQK